MALSTNQGGSWRIKPLPVQLPNHERGTNGTLGYVTARQAPNGVIHILATETQPCLHYELNEAWIFSDAGDVAPETSGGDIKQFSEMYPDGKIRSSGVRGFVRMGVICSTAGRRIFTKVAPKQHEVTYASGRKTGAGNFLVANWTTALELVPRSEKRPQCVDAVLAEWTEENRIHLEHKTGSA